MRLSTTFIALALSLALGKVDALGKLNADEQDLSPARRDPQPADAGGAVLVKTVPLPAPTKPNPSKPTNTVNKGQKLDAVPTLIATSTTSKKKSLRPTAQLPIFVAQYAQPSNLPQQVAKYLSVVGLPGLLSYGKDLPPIVDEIVIPPGSSSSASSSASSSVSSSASSSVSSSASSSASSSSTATSAPSSSTPATACPQQDAQASSSCSCSAASSTSTQTPQTNVNSTSKPSSSTTTAPSSTTTATASITKKSTTTTTTTNKRSQTGPSADLPTLATGRTIIATVSGIPITTHLLVPMLSVEGVYTIGDNKKASSSASSAARTSTIVKIVSIQGTSSASPAATAAVGGSGSGNFPDAGSISGSGSGSDSFPDVGQNPSASTTSASLSSATSSGPPSVPSTSVSKSTSVSTGTTISSTTSSSAAQATTSASIPAKPSSTVASSSTMAPGSFPMLPQIPVKVRRDEANSGSHIFRRTLHAGAIARKRDVASEEAAAAAPVNSAVASALEFAGIGSAPDEGTGSADAEEDVPPASEPAATTSAASVDAAPTDVASAPPEPAPTPAADVPLEVNEAVVVPDPAPESATDASPPTPTADAAVAGSFSSTDPAAVITSAMSTSESTSSAITTPADTPVVSTTSTESTTAAATETTPALSSSVGLSISSSSSVGISTLSTTAVKTPTPAKMFASTTGTTMSASVTPAFVTPKDPVAFHMTSSMLNAQLQKQADAQAQAQETVSLLAKAQASAQAHVDKLLQAEQMAMTDIQSYGTAAAMAKQTAIDLASKHVAAKKEADKLWHAQQLAEIQLFAQSQRLNDDISDAQSQLLALTQDGDEDELAEDTRAWATPSSAVVPQANTASASHTRAFVPGASAFPPAHKGIHIAVIASANNTGPGHAADHSNATLREGVMHDIHIGTTVMSDMVGADRVPTPDSAEADLHFVPEMHAQQLVNAPSSSMQNPQLAGRQVTHSTAAEILKSGPGASVASALGSGPASGSNGGMGLSKEEIDWYYSQYKANFAYPAPNVPYAMGFEQGYSLGKGDGIESHSGEPAAAPAPAPSVGITILNQPGIIQAPAPTEVKAAPSVQASSTTVSKATTATRMTSMMMSTTKISASSVTTSSASSTSKTPSSSTSSIAATTTRSITTTPTPSSTTGPLRQWTMPQTFTAIDDFGPIVKFSSGKDNLRVEEYGLPSEAFEPVQLDDDEATVSAAVPDVPLRGNKTPLFEGNAVLTASAKDAGTKTSSASVSSSTSTSTSTASASSSSFAAQPSASVALSANNNTLTNLTNSSAAVSANISETANNNDTVSPLKLYRASAAKYVPPAQLNAAEHEFLQQTGQHVVGGNQPESRALEPVAPLKLYRASAAKYVPPAQLKAAEHEFLVKTGHKSDEGNRLESRAMRSVIEVLYPAGSSNPGGDTVGGAQFYALTPLAHPNAIAAESLKASPKAPTPSAVNPLLRPFTGLFSALLPGSSSSSVAKASATTAASTRASGSASMPSSPGLLSRQNSNESLSDVNLSTAQKVTFSYSVWFPPNFQFVKGGKLPGLYGGKEGCSGGDSAADCWSSRMMWREDGAGELYLYVPQQLQDRGLCKVPPLSVCDAAYGVSIGRGSFKFHTGAWTHILQTLTMGSHNAASPDGALDIVVDGVRRFSFDKVFYPAAMRGIFFSTFFGGHGDDWATPVDQKAWFRDFSLSIDA